MQEIPIRKQELRDVSKDVGIDESDDESNRREKMPMRKKFLLVQCRDDIMFIVYEEKTGTARRYQIMAKRIHIFRKASTRTTD